MTLTAPPPARRGAGFDTDRLSLREVVQLQIRLAQALKRRFEKPRGLAFSDVVNSTAYGARFGDDALRALNHRHLELVERAIVPCGGRVVDVAGDGAFTCFPGAEQALQAMIALQRSVREQNLSHAREHRLAIRVGVHWGTVLIDGAEVTGHEVNLCARVAASTAPDEIRITRAAFLELPNAMRIGCTDLPPEALKGFDEPVHMLHVAWQATRRPTEVLVHETGERHALPDKERITFGRLHGRSGGMSNDIVLALPDAEETKAISRWHFELRRQGEGCVARSLTSNAMSVDGEPLAKGEERPVAIGSVVNVADVVTLEFLGEADDGTGAPELDATQAPAPREQR